MACGNEHGWIVTPTAEFALICEARPMFEEAGIWKLVSFNESLVTMAPYAMMILDADVDPGLLRIQCKTGTTEIKDEELAELLGMAPSRDAPPLTTTSLWRSLSTEPEDVKEAFMTYCLQDGILPRDGLERCFSSAFCRRVMSEGSKRASTLALAWAVRTGRIHPLQMFKKGLKRALPRSEAPVFPSLAGYHLAMVLKLYLENFATKRAGLGRTPGPDCEDLDTVSALAAGREFCAGPLPRGRDGGGEWEACVELHRELVQRMLAAAEKRETELALVELGAKDERLQELVGRHAEEVRHEREKRREAEDKSKQLKLEADEAHARSSEAHRLHLAAAGRSSQIASHCMEMLATAVEHGAVVERLRSQVVRSVEELATARLELQDERTRMKQLENHVAAMESENRQLRCDKLYDKYASGSEGVFLTEETYRGWVVKNGAAAEANREAKALVADYEERLRETTRRAAELYSSGFRTNNNEGNIVTFATSIIIEMLLIRGNEEAVTPRHLQEVWKYLAPTARYLLSVVPTHSYIRFSDVENLHYRLGGKANAKMLSVLLPYLYALDDEDILAELEDVDRFTAREDELCPDDREHSRSVRTLAWVHGRLDTILEDKTAADCDAAGGGRCTLPQLLSFLDSGGILAEDFTPEGNTQRVVDDVWLSFPVFPLADPLPRIAFTLFYDCRRVPCTVARLPNGMRRDELPFDLADLRPGKTRNSSWWDLDTPSQRVMEWLELTASPAPLEDYFGPKELWPAAADEDQSRSILRLTSRRGLDQLCLQGVRGQFLSQWTLTGHRIVPLLGYPPETPAFECIRAWVIEMEMSQTRMEVMGSNPLWFKFYCAARCLSIVREVASGELGLNNPRGAGLRCQGRELYLAFATRGPRMARMYIWMVRSGILVEEAPQHDPVSTEQFHELLSQCDDDQSATSGVPPPIATAATIKEERGEDLMEESQQVQEEGELSHHPTGTVLSGSRKRTRDEHDA
jgi:hypothetical protein